MGRHLNADGGLRGQRRRVHGGGYLACVAGSEPADVTVLAQIHPLLRALASFS